MPRTEPKDKTGKPAEPQVRGAFSVATVAEALDVSRTTIWTWAKDGRLEAFRLTPSGKSPFRITRTAIITAYGQDVVQHCDRIEARNSRRS